MAALKQLGFGKRSFEDNIQEEVKAFLKVLDEKVNVDLDPTDMLSNVISNVICAITFGKRFEYDDPEIKKFLNIFEENMKLVGGTSILNFFPFLKYLPGDIFKFKMVLKNVEVVQVFIRNTVDKHIQEFNSGDIHDFIDAYLQEMYEEAERNPDTTFNYDQLVKVIGDLFVGGTETTATTLRWALIFLVRNPDVQQRMYEEIRDVVGRSRRPALDDKEDLPYTEAAILEIQRCADIAPFAVAHGTSQDVKFRDYLIPANSIIVPNVHSVMTDHNLWESPNQFRPERFLGREGNVRKPEHFIPFFMGRRSCPGEPVAKMELFLVLTSLVQRYEIRPPSSGDLPSTKGVVGVTHTPSPYKIRLVRHVGRD